MKIYRVEHISGNGIWWAETENGNMFYREFSFFDELNIKANKFPTVFEDTFINGEFIREVHYCAFKSLRQLNIWIREEWRQELKDLGFKFYEIEIDEKHCLIGKKQICFKKEHIINKREIV